MPQLILPVVCLDPQQRCIVESRINSSIIINGGHSSGKTSILLHYLWRISREQKGNGVLFLAPTSLFKKVLDSELTKLHVSCTTDTLDHFLLNPRYYDFIIVDDAHRDSLTELESIKAYGGIFILACDFSCPLIDHFYLGTDRLSDMELPPAEGIKELFDAKVFDTSPVFHQTPFNRLLGDNDSSPISLMKPIDGCYTYQINSLFETCQLIVSFLTVSDENDVGILSYTRKGVEEANKIFKELGCALNTFLPGKGGIDSFHADSPPPRLLTIQSSIGLHFKHVFVLPCFKDFDEDSFEIVVSRAQKTLTFFYEDRLDCHLKEHVDCISNQKLPSSLSQYQSDNMEDIFPF